MSYTPGHWICDLVAQFVQKHMLLLLRSEIFLYLNFGRHTKPNNISLELGFGVVVASITLPLFLFNLA